jgi:thiosulfate reductase cytochrome b subunit
MDNNPAKREKVPVHPLTVRVFHWINAVAIILMIMSGWRIYNASPLFSFHFPNEITLGGWLAGALQWHFAAMWLLTINLLVYLAIGLFTRHFRRSFFPVSPRSIVHDLGRALRGRLPHETGRYNAVQKVSYIGVLLAIILTIVSGLCVWKPVQLQELAWLMGGYEGARLVHFAGMTMICAFIVVHLVLVLLVPSTLLPMIVGWARKPAAQPEESGL